MSEKNYTQSQQNVIRDRGKNMLVSASAGTGKTTVMIERIVSLLAEGADVSEIVVVTFTNLAAAEMKNRLASKLAERRNDKRLFEQLERLDGASISTLHSFCSELLRNYFYVVDIDPSFTILDNNVVATLRKNALNEVFLQYFAEKDETFKKVYRIFAKSRQEANFEKVIFDLYDFSRCIENFHEWYLNKRDNLLNYSEENPFIVTLKNDIKESVGYYADNLENLYERSIAEGLTFADVFKQNAEKLRATRFDNFENALFDVYKLSFEKIPNRSQKTDFGVDKEIENRIREDYKSIVDDCGKFIDKYASVCRGEKAETIWQETVNTVPYLDKLAEIVERFDATYYAAKKERGGVDFNDLEHLTLRLLRDEEARASIRERYKLIFIDEYQDTNPVQEAIVSALSTESNLFMVGDVKQSIYGFRGCEPSIFVNKYRQYKSDGTGQVEELNDNFRSNVEILNFVNDVFCRIMTASFGKVDYAADAQLRGSELPKLKTASARIDLLVTDSAEKREAEDVYDITAEEEPSGGVRQGDLIVKRIKEYVGTVYEDKDGKTRRIGYGDIVILMRSLKEEATDIYNSLVAANIPVAANFKADGFSTKEIKDLINLLRALDNPYNDVYIVGVCLSPFGQFTESELGEIRLDTEGRIPFYERLIQYAEKYADNEISRKINETLSLLEELRFYSRSASVCEVILKAMELTGYRLYVQGLPNCGLRIRKMYNFIDSVKDAPYAQSIDRFLSYVDEADDYRVDEGTGQTNAVRIMTMHASKGLEFPVVIIAELERRFHSGRDAVSRNLDLGLAMPYYNFDNMRYSPTFAAVACNMFNSVKEKEEEMRLLYVAMTRAKFVLNLVGQVSEKQLTALPKLTTKATSHMDWMLAVLRDKIVSAQDFRDNSTEINVIREIPQEETSESTQSDMCEQETDYDKVAERIGYEYPYKNQTSMPSKIVSSALDKSYIDMGEQADYVIVADNDRNYVGTAYHKVYQYVSYDADKSEIAETISSLVNDGQIEQRFAERLDADLIFNTLNNSELRKILAEGKVYHELPFMLYAPYNELAPDGIYSDEVMLQGVIDLLVINGDKATVIDFKYTARSDKAESRYKAQLNSYKTAVRQICGISDVRCFILSIADNKLIKM
ncbi:MAG: UvrD-helicase domain-containing protein [Corallococcus sp.]|nr:UvrD-helicase domain-containing protein [Bacillota bacterium]MCM1533511.1 UvrD-helicase domain-containing protein [Corallococcus sp.]